MATAIDIGDPDDIHPADKRSVGRRLAALALRECFGHGDVEAYGPRVSRVEIEGAEVRVRLAHAAGLRTADGSATVFGFELAGADQAFCAAEGRIDGEHVVVRSTAVTAPLAVRYAFADCPHVQPGQRCRLCPPSLSVPIAPAIRLHDDPCDGSPGPLALDQDDHVSRRERGRGPSNLSPRQKVGEGPRLQRHVAGLRGVVQEG